MERPDLSGLSECIKGIIMAQGADVLSDKKFWYNLSDLHDFGNDFMLKRAFKLCVDKGYIRILSESIDRNSALSYISQTIQLEKWNNQFSEDDLATCLFSVAIGIGICSNSDYEKSRYFNTNNLQNKEAIANQDSISNPIRFNSLSANLKFHIDKTLHAIKYYFSNISLTSIAYTLFLSIVYSIGSALLITSLILAVNCTYNDMGGSMIVAPIALGFQCAFLALLGIVFKRINYEDRLVRSVAITLSIGFIIVDSIPVLRIFPDCTMALFRFMQDAKTDITYLPESFMSFFGIAGTIYYMEPFVKVLYAICVFLITFTLFRVAKKCLYNISGSNYNIFDGCSRTALILSSSIIILAVASYFGYVKYEHSTLSYPSNHNSLYKSDDKSLYNMKIGFENYSLGDPLLEKDSKPISSNLTFTDADFFNVTLLCVGDTPKLVINDSSIALKIKYLLKKTTINGEDITFRILTHNDSIVGIVVKPSTRNVFVDIEGIYDLYKEKYGQFSQRKIYAKLRKENSDEMSIYQLREHSKEFRNAEIVMTIFGIVYVDKRFKRYVLNLLDERKNELKEKEMETNRREMENERAKKRRDLDKRKRDSILKQKEYQRTIETI